METTKLHIFLKDPKFYNVIVQNTLGLGTQINRSCEINQVNKSSFCLESMQLAGTRIH